MEQKARRVALMLDLQWPYKRHAGIFAGPDRASGREPADHSIGQLQRHASEIALEREWRLIVGDRGAEVLPDL